MQLLGDDIGAVFAQTPLGLLLREACAGGLQFLQNCFHIVPGGHTDSVTGSQCHWNVFRVCNTTRMETNSVSKLLLNTYGKKWYFITTDYAFGHSLQQGFEASLKTANGAPGKVAVVFGVASRASD